METSQLQSESLCWLTLPEIQLYLQDGEVRGPRYYMNYTAIKDGKVLFSGNDFSPSPFESPRSLACLISCLSFLTAQPGDTDPSYFKNYSDEQMKWATSQECENLKGVISDYEDTNSLYQEDAKKYLEVNYYH